MGFPVSISKWNLLQNFKRTGMQFMALTRRLWLRQGTEK